MQTLVTFLKYGANNFKLGLGQYFTAEKVSWFPQVTDDVSTTKLGVIFLMTYGNMVTVIWLSWVNVATLSSFNLKALIIHELLENTVVRLACLV